jgi:hypothetical protein
LPFKQRLAVQTIRGSGFASGNSQGWQVEGLGRPLSPRACRRIALGVHAPRCTTIEYNNLGENHSGELHRETANRIISEEMSRLGWKETELACRLKNDPGKLAVAARVRKQTTLPVKWIAERLQMGTSKSLQPMLLRCCDTRLCV